MDITKRQHIVPVFYLKSWQAAGGNFLHLYDLEHKRVHKTNPESALVRRYYYEASRTSPDNRLETILAEMEGRASSVIHRINDIVDRSPSFSDESRLKKDLRTFLTEDNRRTLKEFAAYQYLRIPGAIERKAYELRPAGIDSDTLAKEVNIHVHSTWLCFRPP